MNEEIKTAVPKEKLSAWLEATARIPDNFHPHPKIKKLLEARREMAKGKELLDWSAAEALACSLARR